MELMEELEIVKKAKSDLYYQWIMSDDPAEWLQIKAELSALDRLDKVIARSGAE